jgi:hypothetical protein
MIVAKTILSPFCQQIREIQLQENRKTMSEPVQQPPENPTSKIPGFSF